MTRPTVFTIGHSNHPLHAFLGLLSAHRVGAVADVRSVPYSRFHPHFSRKPLEQALRGHEIAYQFLGAELGARPQDSACYESGKVQYRRLMQTEPFKAGLQHVAELAQAHRLALLCAEQEPLACHRTILVGRELEVQGFGVVHIHADGHLEPHAEAMERLVVKLRMPAADLFRTRDELIAEAYACQEQRIAYVTGA